MIFRITIWTDFSYVLPQSRVWQTDRGTDRHRRTDRRTDSFLVTRPRQKNQYNNHGVHELSVGWWILENN